MAWRCWKCSKSLNISYDNCFVIANLIKEFEANFYSTLKAILTLLLENVHVKKEKKIVEEKCKGQSVMMKDDEVRDGGAKGGARSDKVVSEKPVIAMFCGLMSYMLKISRHHAKTYLISNSKSTH